MSEKTGNIRSDEKGSSFALLFVLSVRCGLHLTIDRVPAFGQETEYPSKKLVFFFPVSLNADQLNQEKQLFAHTVVTLTELHKTMELPLSAELHPSVLFTRKRRYLRGVDIRTDFSDAAGKEFTMLVVRFRTSNRCGIKCPKP
jgi:hypothetical protein